MSKPNLLVVSPRDHYALRNLAQVKELANISISNDEGEIQHLGKDADILLHTSLTGKTVAFAKVWPHTRKVKWVHSLSAGVERVLIPAFRESPVPLTNARGVFKRSLAEFALLGMLYFSKRVRRLVESQRAHKWDDFSTEFIENKVMGIVGYGEIGRECALLAKPLGVKIYAVRRNPSRSANDPLLDKIFAPDELSKMLAETDVLIAAAPLTPETKHMLGDSAFRAMKPSAIVINVGRGPVIDEAALVRALAEKRLGGAALDVFETEPLAGDSPLWDMENVLLSPHCTDRTVNPDWLDLSMQCFIDNFRRYMKGEPLENLVDKKAGY
ncbi:MAG TPA: D-2-hydroxyacid dehydrogenase [Bryobacteraceae bacterium]